MNYENKKMSNFEKIFLRKHKLTRKVALLAFLLFIGLSNLFSYQLEPKLNIQELLNIIKYDKDDNKRLESYLTICRDFVENLNPNANVYLQDAILLAKQLNNYPAIVEANMLYARYHYYRGDIEESTFKIKDAIVANEQIHNKKWFGQIYFQLGENYRVAGALDLAYDNFKKSFDYASNIKDSFLISNLYNRYAIYFFENLDIIPEISRDSSLYYANLSMDLCNRLNNIRYIIANYNVLGLIYRYKFNNLDTSNFLFHAGLDIAIKHNKVNQLPNIYYNIARGHLINKEIDSAKKYIDLGYKVADSLEMAEAEFLFYQLYSNYYAFINDYKNAYEYADMYTFAYKKSQDNKSSFKVKSALNELQFRNRVIEQERQQQTRNFLLIIAAMVIVFFIVLLIVLFMRNKHIAKTNLQLIEKNEQIEASNIELDKQNKIISEQNIKLEESNASKDKLFSIISHDLKNPIGGLKEMITVLAENFHTFDEEEKKEILQELKSTSDNVLELLLGLLTWSRSQRNKIEYDPYKQDLFQLVYQNIAIVSSSARNKNITIINSVPENTAAFFDVNMINTVVRNLLTNAIKFSNYGGKIEVKAEQYQEDTNYVLVSISDNGVGIPSDKLDKLFQVKHSFTTIGTGGEKGTGLGLLIVWDFIEKNHGKIWVDSVVGEGTTFYFTLPTEEQHI